MNPQGRLIHELFEEQVARTPEAVAVVQGEESLSYAQLNGLANRLAYQLIERGVKPGAYVTTLGDAARDRLERHLREAYLTGRPDGDRSFVAVALSCRGVVPKD